MKTPICMVLVALLATASADLVERRAGDTKGAPQAVEFQVSKVGRDKTELLKVFEAVNNRPAGWVKPPHGGSRVPRNARVHEVLGGDRYLAYDIHSSKRTTLLPDIHFELPDGSPTFKKGDSVDLTQFKLYSSGPYTYATASNTKRTVHGYAPDRVKRLPAITKAEFVKKLKAGEVFEAHVLVTCPNCLGWKRVNDDSSKSRSRKTKRAADGKKPCSVCDPTGNGPTGLSQRKYLVRW